MGWQPYKLDQAAHDLVFERHQANQKDVLGQVYKMRTTVAYGLERFWGEQLRLKGAEAAYWGAVWTKLVEIMAMADITTIPNYSDQSQQITELWNFPQEDRKVAIAVLIQLCDCMVWWTQRYKKS